ncbi:hypothetical protein [Helicobacter canis]|nr:hypothetical protein [Helicobacter canis]
MAVDKAPFKACKNRSYKKWILGYRHYTSSGLQCGKNLSLEST